MKLSTDQVFPPPQTPPETGCPAQKGRMEKGRSGRGGQPCSAAPECRWKRIKGGWAQLLLPEPLPSVLKQAEALSDPSSCQSQDCLPQAQVLRSQGWGVVAKPKPHSGNPLRPLFLSLHICCDFHWVPRNREKIG